jgi:hypothetical protein
LRFLKNIFSFREQPMKEENIARKNVVKEEETGAGSGNSSTDSVNSGSGPDYQIYIPLGWAP